VASSKLFHGRRCLSSTYISELADDSHIDDLFCTSWSHQRQPGQEGEGDQRLSHSSLCDDEITSCREAESKRRRPALDEMFCTQCSTLDNSSPSLRPPPITDPAHHHASSADSVRKQVSQNFTFDHDITMSGVRQNGGITSNVQFCGYQKTGLQRKLLGCVLLKNTNGLH